MKKDYLKNPDKPFDFQEMKKGFDKQKENGVDVQAKIQELRNILKDRTPYAFNENVIQEGVIELVSALVAKESGDARYALKLMLKSGEIAEEKGKIKVEEEDVIEAKNKVEEDILGNLVNSLPEHQQLALYSIIKSMEEIRTNTLFKRIHGEVMSGEAYEYYLKICDYLNKKPRTHRWFREYINELEMLGLISTVISSKGYRGKTTLIRISYDPKTLKNMLELKFSLKRDINERNKL